MSDHYLELESRWRTQGDKQALLEAESLVAAAAVKSGFSPEMFFHGSKASFNEFRWGKMGLNATSSGKGFYFTNDESLASSYANDPKGSLTRAYLFEAPPISDEKLTVRRPGLRSFLQNMHNAFEAEDEYSSPIHNYGTVEAATQMLLNSKSDVELLADIIGGGGEPETVYSCWYQRTGQSGIVVHDAMGIEDATVRVATSVKYIKRADPFVYSDDGQLIPLSSRFDVTSRDTRGAISQEPVSLAGPSGVCHPTQSRGSRAPVI